MFHCQNQNVTVIERLWWQPEIFGPAQTLIMFKEKTVPSLWISTVSRVRQIFNCSAISILLIFFSFLFSALYAFMHLIFLIVIFVSL